MFGEKFLQLVIATAYINIWVLKKYNIGAPLRKILIHWGLGAETTIRLAMLPYVYRFTQGFYYHLGELVP